MSQLDELIHSAENESMSVRISTGYDAAGRLYEAFKRVTDSKGASNLLYGMVYLITKQVGRSITYKDYEFAAKAIGSSVDYDRFLSKSRECADGNLFINAIQRFSPEETSALMAFCLMLFSADGYVDSREREFLSSVLEN